MKRTPQSSGPWTRAETLDFSARVAVHTARRLARWIFEPSKFAAPTMATGTFEHTLATVHLGRRASSFGSELAKGRWHNLQLAAAALDGVLITAERPFSFWRTLGRITAEKGYMEGAHFAGGCIVPSIGGGICGITDGLFKLALLSDCRILERHGHTLMVDMPNAARRIDATVKWPYVDLRFAPTEGPIAIRCRVDADGLELAFMGKQPLSNAVDIRATDGQRTQDAAGERYINEVQRTRRAAGTGASVTWVETIGRNDKRVIQAPTRNCNNCEEYSCHKNEAASR